MSGGLFLVSMREFGPSPTHSLLNLFFHVDSGTSTGGSDIVFRVIRVIRGTSPRRRKHGSSAALIILLAATTATERIAGALHGIIRHVAHPAATPSSVGSNTSAVVAVETVTSPGRTGKVVLGRLQAEPGRGGDRLTVDGPDGAVGWIGHCAEVRCEINAFPVQLPAAVEGQQAQSREDMLRLESDMEEEDKDKVLGENAFNLLYPRKVVATDIEGDGGEVQGDGGLNPV